MASIKWHPDHYDHRQTQRLPSREPLLCECVRVCDGDTIVVAVDVAGQLLPRIEYVRLAAIDAPELRGPDVAAAMDSREALRQLIEFQRVTVTPCRIWRDPYHRIVARVTLGAVDVGAWLLERGYAVPRGRNKSHTNPMSHSHQTRVAPRSPASRHPH